MEWLQSSEQVADIFMETLKLKLFVKHIYYFNILILKINLKNKKIVLSSNNQEKVLISWQKLSSPLQLYKKLFLLVDRNYHLPYMTRS